MSRSDQHFSTVYITLASVLLGLALEDLVSTVRAVEQRDAFVWVSALFVVHIIMNAWIAYTSSAIHLRLEPHPWDAINVFGLSAAHFAINSFVGSEAPPFLTAVGVYSLIAAVTVHSATVRGRRDPAFHFPQIELRPVVALNVVAGVTFLTFGWLSTSLVTSRPGQLALVVASVPYATLWLFLFWRGWQRGLRAAGRTRAAETHSRPMERIFFYGLFMDEALLIGEGCHPRVIGSAVLSGYRLHIGDRATLVPSASDRALGVVMELAAEEAAVLYAEPSVRAYEPVPVDVTLVSTGERMLVDCYVLPGTTGLTGANPDYAARLSRLVQSLGFDADYVREVAAFAEQPEGS